MSEKKVESRYAVLAEKVEIYSIGGAAAEADILETGSKAYKKTAKASKL